MTQETRTLRTDPTVIFHLIESQAGTLAKALTECVANSIDAHTTQVDITLDRDGFRITDNGIGLQTIAEIDKCFDTIGFVHDDRSRVNGRFGLGRAQAWAFAATVWRTTTFSLDVNVRERGLDYLLTRDLPHQPGLDITARFYEPRTESEFQNDLRELTELVRYVQVPVILNGAQINTLPADAKWSHEDDTCFLKVADGRTLKVYSQGIFVREYYQGQVGVAGILVTKIGHPLQVNVARNDVLTAKCTLWKKLLAKLRKLGDDRATTKTERLTDAQRDYVATRLRSEPDGAQFLTQPIITLTDRRHLTVMEFIRRMRNPQRPALSTAAIGDRVGENAIRTKQAVVLAPATLERFGAETATAFLAALVRALRALSPSARAQTQDCWHLDDFLQDAASIEVYDDLRAAPFAANDDCRLLEAKDTDARAKAVLSGLTKAADGLRGVVARVRNQPWGPARRIVAGESETSEAWTDGHSFIAVRHDLLIEAGKRGLWGLHKVIALLVHEWLHDDNTASSHEHDHEFYETYHDILIDEADRIASITDSVLRATYKNLKKKSLYAAERIDRSEAIGRGEDDAPDADDEPVARREALLA